MTGAVDPPTLRRAMEAYAEALRTHRDEIDSLNVFPVPDGDTGTNLLLTQQAVVNALSGGDRVGADLQSMGDAIARAALLGARGSSGVILSQVLRGLVESWRGRAEVGPDELAAALAHAGREAFRAVARPAEGTVLTVIRAAASAAARAANDWGERGAEDGCEAVLAAALQEARAALGRTRDALPELASAGVVDAGAKGFVLLLDALHAAVAGGSMSEPIGPPGPVGRPANLDTGRIGGRGAQQPLEFPYEVQFLLEAEDAAMLPLRRALAEIGDSLVVVGGGGLFSVHVHTADPEHAVRIGRGAGAPRDVRIADLGAQVEACIGGQARGVQVAESATGLVAVADGPGLTRTFASLGAVVVPGGPGNDPPVGDLLRATETLSAGSVIVLPNHREVVPAVVRAAAESSRDVRVLATRSVPAGLAAATAFNPMSEPDENLASMQEAVAGCRSGALARAERDGDLPDGAVRAGDWVGLVEGDVVVAGASPERCAVQTVARLRAEDSEVLTLIVGADAVPDQVRGIEAALSDEWPGLRIEVVDGGQPRHPFLIGVE